MRLKKELEPLLKIDAVLSLFPVSRSSWYTGIKSGIYPKPVKLGPRSVAWRHSDIVRLLSELPREEWL
jgi:prophage regulatory protein